ncbi:sensor histidine kinase [Nonomuraea sp. JJY05]|uniref:sensor histidine kinase n=1 Tax=Nonomuraea sp. JJY05 TaxID=3350255 RepID=UPI00373DF3B0
MKLNTRVQLTLLYGGLFFTMGLLLLGATYLLVSDVLVDTRLRMAGAADVVPNHAILAPSGSSVFVLVNKAEQLAAQEFYERETLSSLLVQGAIVLGLLGTVAVGSGWLVAGRVLRPFYQVTQTAQRVAYSHNLDERIAYSGPHHDVKELADTFDVMLVRLAAAFAGQKRFVANASHELRTPLAINRTLVEVALRRTDATEDAKRLGESLLAVNAKHERLIEGLLALADSERSVIERPQRFDLAEVASTVLEHATDEAAESGITLHSDLRSAPMTGDPALVERLVQNLVENAVRHNRPDGEVWITTRAESGRAEIAVANTGPVVPAYDSEAIFEPFRQLRTDMAGSSRGSGLGLSIVRATAHAHGGTVVAKPRDGGGLIVTARL